MANDKVAWAACREKAGSESACQHWPCADQQRPVMSASMQGRGCSTFWGANGAESHGKRELSTSSHGSPGCARSL